MTDSAEFTVGDTVRPKDHRRDIEGMTFRIDSEAQIMYHERMKRNLYLTAPSGGIGFLAEELERVPAENLAKDLAKDSGTLETLNERK